MNTSTDRKRQLLGIAVEIARSKGYTKVTREAIADKGKVSPALISHYFGTTVQLKRDIMRAAVQQGIVEVVAQGLADRNPYALKAPDDLKQKAAKHLLG